jgi:hypothetical protein
MSNSEHGTYFVVRPAGKPLIAPRRLRRSSFGRNRRNATDTDAS